MGTKFRKLKQFGSKQTKKLKKTKTKKQIMKILLSPSSAETRHQQQPHHHQIVTSSIATLSETQLNHYLKLQAAQQQIQIPSSQKNEVIVEDCSRFEQHPPRPAAVVDSPSDHPQQQPRQQQQQQHNGHHHHQNGHHHSNGSSTTTSNPSPKFSTTPNHPPLPIKKMIMGKIEHNEALENEAAMQQHAQNLLQLSQEPLVLPDRGRASLHPVSPPSPHHQPQQHHIVREQQELESVPQDLVFRGQKLKDSSVGYFMEVGPTTTTTTTPSIRLTAPASDV